MKVSANDLFIIAGFGLNYERRRSDSFRRRIFWEKWGRGQSAVTHLAPPTPSLVPFPQLGDRARIELPPLVPILGQGCSCGP